MLLCSGKYDPHDDTYGTLDEYMVAHNFVALAGILKCPNQIHYYFGRLDSDKFEVIVDHLLNIEGVQYVDLVDWKTESRIPCYADDKEHPALNAVTAKSGVEANP